MDNYLEFYNKLEELKDGALSRHKRISISIAVNVENEELFTHEVSDFEGKTFYFKVSSISDYYDFGNLVVDSLNKINRIANFNDLEKIIEISKEVKGTNENI